ncbi:hypothetical protein [Nocardioides sp.]|uniref:hypothetical protein n=1 Tax=Nocardioides sp. TaxID=35761 RepID=UPI002D803DBE|nr:hypothetical protein [Nocardioides sp.]
MSADETNDDETNDDENVATAPDDANLKPLEDWETYRDFHEAYPARCEGNTLVDCYAVAARSVR